MARRIQLLLSPCSTSTVINGVLDVIPDESFSVKRHFFEVFYFLYFQFYVEK
jgi:hypothetical protein